MSGASRPSPPGSPAFHHFRAKSGCSKCATRVSRAARQTSRNWYRIAAVGAATQCFPKGMRNTGCSLSSIGSRRGASSRISSLKGTRWMLATSAALGKREVPAPAQTTTGVITNPERVGKSSSRPIKASSSRDKPTSSLSSRNAACSADSPGSIRPPGSAHCPGCRRSSSARRVRTIAASRLQQEGAGKFGSSAPMPSSVTASATAAARSDALLIAFTSSRRKFPSIRVRNGASSNMKMERFVATLETVARPAGVAARSLEREVLSGSLRRGSRHDGPTALAEADSAIALSLAAALENHRVAVFQEASLLATRQGDGCYSALSKLEQ